MLFTCVCIMLRCVYPTVSHPPARPPQIAAEPLHHGDPCLRHQAPPWCLRCDLAHPPVCPWKPTPAVSSRADSLVLKSSSSAPTGSTCQDSEAVPGPSSDPLLVGLADSLHLSHTVTHLQSLLGTASCKQGPQLSVAAPGRAGSRLGPPPESCHFAPGAHQPISTCFLPCDALVVSDTVTSHQRLTLDNSRTLRGESGTPWHPGHTQSLSHATLPARGRAALVAVPSAL